MSDWAVVEEVNWKIGDVAKRPPAARSRSFPKRRGALRTVLFKIAKPLRWLDYLAHVGFYYSLGPGAWRGTLRLFLLLPVSAQIPVISILYVLSADSIINAPTEAMLSFVGFTGALERLTFFAFVSAFPVGYAAAHYVQSVPGEIPPVYTMYPKWWFETDFEERKVFRVATFILAWAATIFLHPDWPIGSFFFGPLALLGALITHILSCVWEHHVSVTEPAPRPVQVVPDSPLPWPKAPRRQVHTDLGRSPADDLYSVPDGGAQWDSLDDLGDAEERYWRSNS